MTKVAITQSKLDDLANAVAAKSGEDVPLTVDEMTAAVMDIEPTDLQSKTVSITPTGSAQSQTVEADAPHNGLEDVTVNVAAIPSNYVGSGVTRRTSSNLTASGATVTAPAGYYESSASKSVSTMTLPSSATTTYSGTLKATIGYAVGSSYRYLVIPTGYNTSQQYYQLSSVPTVTMGTPTASKGAVSNHSIDVTPSVTNPAGYNYITTARDGTAVTVSASELVSGTLNITQNDTGIDVTNYASVDVSVPSGSPSLQSKTKTYTPTETAQSETVTADAGYDGLSSVAVSVGAISSTYVGSGVTQRSSSDLTASTLTVTAPSGYYASNATKTLSDANLVAGNIKKDVSVFGVTGTYEGSGTSKNAQVVQSTTRTSASTLTAIGAELTVSKTGTYDIYYSCFRTNTSTSYTWATRLYINGTAYGTAENTTWTNNQQNTHLSNISLTNGDKLRVYGRNTRGTSYYICAPMLVIVEA